MEGLLARANVLGLALEQKRQVLLVDLEDSNAFYLRYLAEGESYVSLVRSRMLSLLREILLNDSSHHVVSLHGTGAVALLDRRGVEEPAILAKKVYEKLRREFGTMTFVVALGNPYPSPGLLAKSYREA
jgi:sugar diacid utilization regulator